MKNFQIGERIQQFAGMEQLPFFDMDDSGAAAYILAEQPDWYIIRQFDDWNELHIRFQVIHSVIMISLKVGELPWMAMPYTPHLSNGLTASTILEGDEVLKLAVMLVDAEDGKVCATKSLRIQEPFAKEFFAAVSDCSHKEWSEEKYDSDLEGIYKYSSVLDIAETSRFRFDQPGC